MTKNITLRMDEELLRKVKHIAVEQDMSVSAWMTQLAEQEAKKEEQAEVKKKKMEYEKSMDFIMKAMENAGHYGGQKFDRESCYDHLSRY